MEVSLVRIREAGSSGGRVETILIRIGGAGSSEGGGIAAVLVHRKKA